MPLSQQLMLDALCPADLFFPGATKQSFMHLQPGVSHPSIYIDTNGQPSSLPDVEGSAVPRLAVQSPDPSGICEYSRGEGQSSSGKAAPGFCGGEALGTALGSRGCCAFASWAAHPKGLRVRACGSEVRSREGFFSLLFSFPAESGPELRTPDMTAISPSLRNESLVSYASMSEEEEREGREGERGHHGGAMGLQPGPEPPMPAEEDMKLSRQAMLIRRCSSQGSVTSLPEDPLNPVDAHSDWGHEGVSDLPPLTRSLDSSSHPEEQAGGPGPEMGALPRVLMGPTWEKTTEEEPPARSPLHGGALTEESLPSSASPPGDAPAAPGPARGGGMGCSRLREERRESWRTNIHHLLDLEEQWDQLYHQELAMWQEERATQREERARDRELQFRLLGVLTDIRDELRYLRQERASARQSQAPQPEPHPDPSPLLEQPKAEPSFPEPQAGNASWAEPAVPSRSPFGNRGRGRRRGRPRGSASRHRRLFLTNS